MKRTIMIALAVVITTIISAQEKMKVVLNDGTTAEYEVKKIKEIFFEGSELTLTTGGASNITSNSAEISCTIEGSLGNIIGGILLSTSKTLDYDNCQKVVMRILNNGQNSFLVNDLSESTTYYYRAFTKVDGIYYYGEIRSFKTIAAPVTVIYREPYTEWGASKAQTRSYMSGYNLYKEDTNYLAYYGKDSETLVLYNYNNSKLVMASVAVQTSKTTLSAIARQLNNNGYTEIGSDNSLFISLDAKTTVTISTDTDLDAYYIQYYDTNEIIGNQLFEEPYLSWGTARSNVASTMQERGYILYTEKNTASDRYYLCYNGKYEELTSLYYFDSNKRLEEVSIAFLKSNCSIDELMEYLSSTLSYTYIGTNTSKTSYYFLTKDKKSYAIVGNMGDDYVTISYVSSDSMNSNSRKMVRSNDGEETAYEDIEYMPIILNKNDLQKAWFDNLKNRIINNITNLPSLPVVK